MPSPLPGPAVPAGAAAAAAAALHPEDAAPYLSVVIPAYQEAGRLAGNLRHVLEVLAAAGHDHEVLVVDDGSRDGTAASLGNPLPPGVHLLRHERNLGKGAAVRTGVLASRGRWLLITDADLSTPIEELPRLLAAAAMAPVVFGSRAVPGATLEVRQARRREVLGRGFNRLLRLLRLTELHDTQCGFKLLDGALARELFPRLAVSRYAFDVELAWEARRAGHAVREVGVVWRDSGRSTVRPWRDGLVMVRDVLRLRLRRR